MTSVTDPAGNAIANTYDLRGRKTASSDPDMGAWSYAYDVASELLTQTDAKSQVTTLTYDVLGRPLTRAESGLYSAWTYGTTGASHNVGLPIEAKACTASGCSTVVSDRAFSYDSLARPYQSALAVDGTTYTYTSAYNADGRLSTVSYPSGFVARHVYTSLGYECAVADNGGSPTCSSTSSNIWTADTADAELHLLTQTAGNTVLQTDTFDANTGRLLTVKAGPSYSVAQFGYEWDSIGNLTKRTDDISSVYEKFCYDSLNRPTSSATASSLPTACTSTGGGITSKTIAYDSLGNITSRNDVGTYAYPASGSSSVQPHAVSSITGTVNGVTNPSYTYDANGNMTAGAGRSVTYTAFNMAAAVTQGSTVIGLTYDDGHSRIKQCVGTSCATSTTYYLADPASGAISEKYVAGGTTTWHDYFAEGGSLVAERFCTGATPCSTGATWRYFVADHLGSSSVLTDGSGAVTERLSYDAWGRRRNSNGTDNSACSITSATTRGFTGHEMMDVICEINANARIYDPTIGRFMSADSMVPNPFNGQAFNRFSYVGNNPLSATDPSGHVQNAGCANGDNGPGCPKPLPIEGMGSGMPCWGCSGQGIWSVTANGMVISAQFAGSLFAAAAGTGGTVELYSYGDYSNGEPHTSSETIISSSGISSGVATVPSGIVVPFGDSEFGFNSGSSSFYGSGSREPNGAGWYEPLNTGIGGVGVGASIAQYGSGAAALGSNLRFYSGWGGNQYVSTLSIARTAGKLGFGLTVVSAGLDLIAYQQKQLSAQHLAANLTMDGVGLMGGWVGAAYAAGYYGLETYYPGGAAGALNDYGKNIQENQAINPNYTPMDPGKISFRPKKRAPDAAPDHKKPKKHDDVIDSYDMPMDPEKI